MGGRGAEGIWETVGEVLGRRRSSKNAKREKELEKGCDWSGRFVKEGVLRGARKGLLPGCTVMSFCVPTSLPAYMCCFWIPVILTP